MGTEYLISPSMNLLRGRDATATRAAEMYEPILSAVWGFEPSLPRTKKVAIMEAKIPTAAITRG